MRVLLCALTGMGNKILPELLSFRHLTDLHVVTRKERGEYPHFSCPDLETVCKKDGIKVATDVHFKSAEGRLWLEKFRPDLVLTATFNQIIPVAELDRGTLAVNIHPSLLPDFKGPTPTEWAILLEEEYAGVTYHFLTDEIDGGEIILQRSLLIKDMNNGELRESLYSLAAEMLPEFMDAAVTGKLPSHPQSGKDRYFPHFFSADGQKFREKMKLSGDTMCMKRALAPYPGELV